MQITHGPVVGQFIVALMLTVGFCLLLLAFRTALLPQ
jgi:hypothetical protein